MYRKGKLKLTMTALMLFMSVVLLVTASFAWFTLSTSPEISGLQVTLFTDRDLLISADGENFTQSIDLSEVFKYYAPLKPVSTADGVNWFLPSYKNDVSGELLPIGEFILDDTLEHGNVLVYNQNADGSYSEMNEVDYFEASEKGYYVYCNFWLMTELDEGCKVTLSAPDLTKNNLEPWELLEDTEHGAKYGSYALGAYQLDEDGNLEKIDNNAQTSLRVGFLMDKDTANERFVIYEPNADQRSSWVDKPNGSEFYIHGFDLIENENYTEGSDEPRYSNYIDNSYIPTQPIGVKVDANGDPLLDANGNKIPELKTVDPEDHIVQLAGKWAQNELEKRLNGEKGNSLEPNSNDILEFGKFVKYTNKLTVDEETGIHEFAGSDEMDLASSSLVVELEKDTPKQITMFIWIEGQDPDCWNDIASGSFVVNLEFAAQPPKND